MDEKEDLMSKITEEYKFQLDLHIVFKCLELLRIAIAKYGKTIIFGRRIIDCDEMEDSIILLMEAIRYMLDEQAEREQNKGDN